ncbi:MAG: type II toxin-antitoxin system HicB family antitoxin [Patescibacteria group bacterium]
MKKVEQIYRFPVVIERDSDGYFATCPDMQGCYSQGDTYEEVLENITSAIKLHVEDRKAENEEVSQPNTVSLSTVEVSVA